jgi:hypothetical protein
MLVSIVPAAARRKNGSHLGHASATPSALNQIDDPYIRERRESYRNEAHAESRTSRIYSSGGEARAAFGNGVVEKLIKSGVNPIARSKTELGSQCR